MTLNRRQFMTAKPQVTHISSLVVHSRADAVEAVVEAVGQLPNVEVPNWDPGGKFVALLESSNEGEMLERITEIEALPGVIGASLVYHQIDD